MTLPSRQSPSHRAAPARGPIAARYAALASAGAIEPDPAQEMLAVRLDDLCDRLAMHRMARKSSPLGWLFGQREPRVEPMRGVYIWGAVGRGKSMLMDMFFAAAPVARKRRAHFHAFMADVHARVHAHRQAIRAGEAKDGDPIAPVAAALADEAWLLCFDEFAVTDIADAMILGRLFTALFARGVVLVATSNIAPAGLYADGLNRALFVPFIAQLEACTDVIELTARTDFRLEKLAGAPTWITPADAHARAALDRIFASLIAGAQPVPLVLRVQGRETVLRQHAGGVVRAGFAELCGQPLGASDYLALARAIDTLMVDDIPTMAFENRNEARRFITLIDALYEARVKLVASAAAAPQGLYAAEAGPEAFAFARTVSRLIEMGSTDYLALPRMGRAGSAGGDTGGLVET